MTALIRC